MESAGLQQQMCRVPGSQQGSEVPPAMAQDSSVAFSDVPLAAGLASPALMHCLLAADLEHVNLLLMPKGVHTCHALLQLSAQDRAFLQVKALALYEVIGGFGIVQRLTKLFEAEGVPTGVIPAVSAGNMPLPPGAVATSGSASSSSEVPASLQGSGGSGVDANWLAQSAASSSSTLLVLPAPHLDDTACHRELVLALEGVMPIIGPQRVNVCIHHLLQSEQMSAASAMEAGAALGSLRVPKGDLRDGDFKELLKTVKRCVRNVLVWRCCGQSMGLDSKAAMLRNFTEATRQSDCDDNTVSQLQNGLRKIIEGLPALVSQQRSGSPARERLQKANSKLPDAVGSKGSGVQASPGEAHLCWASAAPATPMYVPDPAWCQAWLPGPPGLDSGEFQTSSTIVGSQEGSVSTCTTSRARGISQLPLPIGQKPTLEATSTTSQVSKFRGSEGDLSACVVGFLLEKLSCADSGKECMECASWLAHAYSYTIPDRDETLVSCCQTALVQTIQSHEADKQVMHQVLMALAHTAGSHFPWVVLSIELNAERFWMAVSETWHCLLTEGHGIVSSLKVTGFDAKEIQQLVGFTIELSSQFGGHQINKELAMQCCESLGALCWLVKDDESMALKLEKHVFTCVQEFQGHPQIVHAGLVTLVKLCQERKDIFGVCVGPSHSGKKISEYLIENVMGLMLTLEACNDFLEDTFDVAIKLLVHVYPLDEIIRFLIKGSQTSCKKRCWCKLNIVVEQLQATFQEDPVLAQYINI